MLLAIVAVMVVSGAASIAAVYAFRRGQEWVAHTLEVERALERVRADLYAAESAQRRYVITGVEAEAARFDQQAAAAARSVAALREMTADNPNQTQRLAELAALVDRRIERLRTGEQARRRGGEEAALAVVRSPVGADLMTSVARLTADASAEEERLLVHRMGTARSAGVLATALVGTTGAAAVLLVVLGWRARRALVLSTRAVLAAQEELRRLNAELEARVASRTRELAEANAELEAFGYSVSHDLRAPLRSVHGFAQALREDYAPSLPAGALEHLSRIGLAAERMDALIQDLLAYSRLSRAQVELRPVSLETAVDEALTQLHGAIAASGAHVVVRRPLPQVCAERTVLVQIIANLLSNAVKFRRAGAAPRVEICAAQDQRSGQVRLSVRDRGIGVAPEHHERIFRVFERLHTTGEYPGTGIGLAIVRKGIERMGGTSGVESNAPTGEGDGNDQDAGGSTFWIELKGAGA